MTIYDKSGSRLEPYKEDSTKGSSLIQPLNYKGDVMVQVWIDARILATLTRWMEGAAEYPRFMSEIVRRPLEVMVESLVEHGEVEIVDDTAEARAMLERRYRVVLNKGGRGGKNILHNQVLSSQRGELSERLRRERRSVDDVVEPQHTVRTQMRGSEEVTSEEEYQEIRLKIQRERHEEFVRNRDEQIKGMKDAGRIVEEPSKVIDRSVDQRELVHLSHLSHLSQMLEPPLSTELLPPPPSKRSTDVNQEPPHVVLVDRDPSKPPWIPEMAPRKLTIEECEAREKEIEERDKVRRTLENAPVNMEWLRKNMVKP